MAPGNRPMTMLSPLPSLTGKWCVGKGLRCIYIAVLALGLLVTVSACASSQAYPYPFKDQKWMLSITIPAYMEVWVEHSRGVDIKGRGISGLGGGIMTNNAERTATWPAWGGGKSTSFLYDNDLPVHLYIRWQSLVEPQTYEAFVAVPQSLRDKMLEPCKRRESDLEAKNYRTRVILGIAPGGLVVLFLAGCTDDNIEMARAQARIVEAGPYSGGRTLEENNGKIRPHRPMKESARKFVEKNGIPYGSW